MVHPDNQHLQHTDLGFTAYGTALQVPALQCNTSAPTTHLSRGQPQWPLPAEVLCQNRDHPLNGAEYRTMNDDRSLLLVAVTPTSVMTQRDETIDRIVIQYSRHVVQVKTNRKLKIELNRSALVRASKSVHYL